MDEIQQARQAAGILWREWRDGAGDAPDLAAVPIEEIAQDQGVMISEFARDARPGTLGYLDPDDDDLIWIRAGLAPAVRRFTIAHELGHWRLHGASRNDDRCEPQDVTDLEDLRVLGPEEAYSPRSRREQEANAFAAEALAPRAIVRAAYLGAAQTLPLAVEAIAARLQISRAVGVTMQLASLLTDSLLAEESAAPVTPAQAVRLVNLDRDQRAAVTAPTPALILAGPATGDQHADRAHPMADGARRARGRDPGAQLQPQGSGGCRGAAGGDAGSRRCGALAPYAHLSSLLRRSVAPLWTPGRGTPGFPAGGQISGFYVLRDLGDAACRCGSTPHFPCAVALFWRSARRDQRCQG